MQICLLLILACSLTSVHGLGAPLDGLLDGDVALAARTDDKVCVNFNSTLRQMHLGSSGDWLIKLVFDSEEPCCHCDVKSIPKVYKALDGLERSMKSSPYAENLKKDLKSVRHCIETKCSKKNPSLRSVFNMLKWMGVEGTACELESTCLPAHDLWLLGALRVNFCTPGPSLIGGGWLSCPERANTPADMRFSPPAGVTTTKRRKLPAGLNFKHARFKFQSHVAFLQGPHSPQLHRLRADFGRHGVFSHPKVDNRPAGNKTPPVQFLCLELPVACVPVETTSSSYPSFMPHMHRKHSDMHGISSHGPQIPHVGPTCTLARVRMVSIYVLSLGTCWLSASVEAADRDIQYEFGRLVGSLSSCKSSSRTEELACIIEQVWRLHVIHR